jgi:gliding motility-associated-like protein
MIKKILVILLFPCLVSAQSAFISGNDTICDNGSMDAQVKVYFSGAAPPFTFVYAIDSISQPSITTTINPYIINTKAEGGYTLTSFADALTVDSISGFALVTIHQAPTANFTVQPDSMTILYTTTQLVDKSEGNIINWQWNFGDNSFDSLTSPYHTYPDSIAVYQVSLVITDSEGCSDTTFKHVQITDDHWIYIPNAFTPDLDGKNDNFCISYHGVREETFTLNLYSRFSELVYSTNNINDLRCIYDGGHLINGWNGKHQVTGNDLPAGIYIYEVSFQDLEGWKHQDRGHLFIIR